MAVEQTGSWTFWESQTEDSSQAITVPTDAELCIVVATGYPRPDNQFFDELNFDNGGTLDFTLIIEGEINQYHQSTAWYIDSDDANFPSSGAQTLYWSTPDTMQEGYTFGVGFFKGVDVSDPIGDAEENGSGGWGQTSWTSALTGVSADDMGVLLAYAYQHTPDVDATGQTSHRESLYNSAGFGLATELGEGALQTSATNNLVALAFAINASSGGGTTVDFTGNPIDSTAPVIDQGTLTATRSLSGNSILLASPVIDQASLTLEVGLNGNPITSAAPSLDQGVVAQIVGFSGNTIDGVAPTLGQGTLSVTRNLTGNLVDLGAPLIDQASLTLTVGLSGNPIDAGAPLVDQGTVEVPTGEIVEMVGNPIDAVAAVVDQGTLGVTRNLAGNSILMAASLLDQATLTSVVALSGNEVTMGAPLIDSGVSDILTIKRNRATVRRTTVLGAHRAARHFGRR